jgi:hypothetical protein
MGPSKRVQSGIALRNAAKPDLLASPLTLLKHDFCSRLLLSPNSSALAFFLFDAIATIIRFVAIVLFESHPHAIFFGEFGLVVLFPQLAPGLGSLLVVRRGSRRRFTAGHLPFHQLCESTVLVSGELGVRADLGDAAVAADADDDVAALNCAEAVGDGDGGVVSLEELGKGLVDESLRFGIKSRRCFVEDQDVGVLEQGTGDSNALLLSA